MVLYANRYSENLADGTLDWQGVQDYRLCHEVK